MQTWTILNGQRQRWGQITCAVAVDSEALPDGQSSETPGTAEGSRHARTAHNLIAHRERTRGLDPAIERSRPGRTEMGGSIQSRRLPQKNRMQCPSGAPLGPLVVLHPTLPPVVPLTLSCTTLRLSLS